MQTSNQRYPLLDALRYVAAIIVAVCHYNLQFGGYYVSYEYLGIIAVEVFFVLSGFVLANQINLILLSRDKITFLKIFLSRRWIRTIPSYLVALTFAGILFGYGDLYNLFIHVIYSQNLISDRPPHQFFSVGWSLSVEEWFYIIFPSFLLVSCKFYKSRQAYFHSTILFLLLFGLMRALCEPGTEWGTEVRRAVIFRLDSIAYGYLSFTLKDQLGLKNNFLIFAVLAFIFVFFNTQNSILLANNYMQNAFPIVCGVFFGSLMIILSKITQVNKNPIIKVLDFLARTSYPIYLFHIIVIGLMKLSGNSSIWGFLISIHVFAIVFHFAFEYQLLANRPKYPKL